MALGTGHNTTTTGAVLVPEVWDQDALDIIKKKYVFADTVTRKDSVVAGKGDTIHVPVYTRGTANDKAALTQVTLQGQTFPEIPVLIDKHKEYSDLVEDILKLQSAYELRQPLLMAATESLAEAVDVDIRDAMVAAFATDIGPGAGNAITEATVRAAMVALDNANVPREDRYLVVSPAGYADLLGIDRFVSRDFVDEAHGGQIENGKVGAILGFDVRMSTNLNVGQGFAYHKESFALAMQQKPRNQSQYKQEYLGHLYTMDTVYGVKGLRDGTTAGAGEWGLLFSNN